MRGGQEEDIGGEGGREGGSERGRSEGGREGVRVDVREREGGVARCLGKLVLNVRHT